VADVLLEDGRIAAVEPGIAADGVREIDAVGLTVAPGLVDMHVHLREPGYEYKEDIASGSAAAAAGGFTSVACMPNTNPALDDEPSIAAVLSRAAEVGLCRVHPIAAITRGRAGKDLTEMVLLERAGAVGFSDDGDPVGSSRVMRRALEYSRLTSRAILSHSEDRDLSAGGHMNEGRMSTLLGIPGMPAAAEEIGTERDIRLAEMTGGRLHVCHVSTAGSVEILRQAKRRGVRVTAEAAPHHFTLTDEAVEGYDASTKMSPPLRTPEDRSAIIEGLADGTLDAIATDHAPHADREKLVEFDRAPFGIIGLETALGLAVTELVAGGHMTLPEVIAKMSIIPSQILGIDAGTLSVGAVADIVLIDPQEKWTVSQADLRSKARNTPFIDRALVGRAVLTLLGGETTHAHPDALSRITVQEETSV
jgi:dihydroorotase